MSYTEIYAGGSPVYFDERYPLTPNDDEQAAGYHAVALFIGYPLDGHCQGKKILAWTALDASNKETTDLTRVKQRDIPTWLARIPNSTRQERSYTLDPCKHSLIEVDKVTTSFKLPQGGVILGERAVY